MSEVTPQPLVSRQDIWKALRGWLQADESGRGILSTLATDPDRGAQALAEWLRRVEPPTGSAAVATYVTGGSVNKLVNIARAETVNITVERVSARALAQLPPDIDDFTGREEVLARVRELIVRGIEERRAVVITLVTGKPGIGKTALAVHLAHQLGSLFPEGQLYVNLRGVEAQRLDPEDVLARLLRAFGVDGTLIPQDLDERVALYRTQFAGQRVHLLLDNAGGERQVRPLLPGSPGSAVLVTSRARLQGLEGAHVVDLEVLPSDGAVDLLSRIAGSERVAAEPDAAAAIARLCGYLPLAIRIAGAKLAARRHWRLSRLADRLSDERERLDELSAGDLEVRAMFALSYDGLDEHLQQAFRLPGLLHAPDFPSWEVAALLDTDLDDAEGRAERLVDAQLFEVTGEDATGEPRYHYHDLLRAFARERLRDTESEPVKSAALERGLGAYLNLGKRGYYLLSPHSKRDPEHEQGRAVQWQVDPKAAERLQRDPYAWFDAEHAGLVHAVEQAYEMQLWELTWELAETLSYFLRVRGAWKDWQHTHELALDAARRAGNRRGQGWTLRNLGNAYRDLRRFDEAIACFQEGLRIFRELGNRLGEAAVLNTLGEVAMDQGRLDEAVTLFSECLPAWREAGDRVGEAYVLTHLGKIYRDQGRWDDSAAHLDQALPLHRELGDRIGEGYCLQTMGDLFLDRGDADRAVDSISRSLALFESIDARISEANVLISLAHAWRSQGRFEEAITTFQRSIHMFQEFSHRHGEAWALAGLGATYQDQGRLDAALDLFTESLELFKGVDDIFGEAISLFGIAGSSHDRRPEEINTLLTTALTIFRQVGARPWEAKTLERLG